MVTDLLVSYEIVNTAAVLAALVGFCEVPAATQCFLTTGDTDVCAGCFECFVHCYEGFFTDFQRKSKNTGVLGEVNVCVRLFEANRFDDTLEVIILFKDLA